MVEIKPGPLALWSRRLSECALPTQLKQLQFWTLTQIAWEKASSFNHLSPKTVTARFTRFVGRCGAVCVCVSSSTTCAILSRGEKLTGEEKHHKYLYPNWFEDKCIFRDKCWEQCFHTTWQLTRGFLDTFVSGCQLSRCSELFGTKVQQLQQVLANRVPTRNSESHHCPEVPAFLHVQTLLRMLYAQPDSTFPSHLWNH